MEVMKTGFVVDYRKLPHRHDRATALLQPKEDSEDSTNEAT